MRSILNTMFTYFRAATLLLAVLAYPYLGAGLAIASLTRKIFRGGEFKDHAMLFIRGWGPWATAIVTAIVVGAGAGLLSLGAPIFSNFVSESGFRLWVHGLALIPMVIFLHDPAGVDGIASTAVAAKPIKMAPAELAATIKQHIYGQDKNIENIATLVADRMAAPRERGPVATIMLAGPTGTGKTETARLMAAALQLPLFIVRCNEYSNKWSVDRLIGASASYKNSEQGGELTNALMSAPRGVLVLDEIEKADAAVAKVLMTLLDEGVITAALDGRVIDARGWIMFATTNAAHEAVASISESATDMVSLRVGIKDALREHWAPEILGRLDRVLAFRRVTNQEDVADKMVNKALDSVFSRLSNVEGSMTDEAAEYMREASQRVGKYGFRELERYIEEVTAMGLAGAQHARRKKPIKLHYYVEANDLKARVVA